MGLFRKSTVVDEPALEEEDAPPCPHVALSPRWENLDDMGREDRISSFVCQSCAEEFTPRQVDELRATEAERIGAAGPA